MGGGGPPSEQRPLRAGLRATCLRRGREQTTQLEASAPCPPPCRSSHFWSAPPSIFGRYKAPLHRVKDWCRRSFGLSSPLDVPPYLQYRPRAYQAVGNIIVR